MGGNRHAFGITASPSRRVVEDFERYCDEEFDVPYTFDQDNVYKRGAHHRADVLRAMPKSLTPDLVFADDDEDRERFVDLTRDDRQTTGPDQIVHRSRQGSLTYVADADLLNRLRELTDDPAEKYLGDMKEHNEELAEIVKELRERGADASPMVACIIRRAVNATNIPPGASFEAPGGGDWAELPAEGSGPAPKLWWGTSEDYVNRHERDDFEDVTDGQVKYTNPGDAPRQRARQGQAPPNPDPGIYAVPTPTDTTGTAIPLSGGAGIGDYAAPPTQAVTRAANIDGRYSGDAIAARAQAFVRTAGRNRTLADRIVEGAF
jgi:hypothetical protein